jgi:ketosteroid isomerase-like protein
MSTRANRPRFPHLNCVDLGARSGLPSLTLMQSAKANLCARAGPSSLVCLKLVSAVLIALCAIPACAALQKQQKRENRHHKIDQLEEAWRTAVLASDANAVGDLLAEDYTAITSNGTLQTRQDWLASLRSGRVHFTSLEISDRKVRFYGDTAVVTSRAEVERTNTEGPVTGSYRYTRVYVRNSQGKWKIVSFEASRIRHPHAIKSGAAQ